MSLIDLGSATIRTEMCMEDAQRWAQTRTLLRQAGLVPQGWASRQGCWLLCQLGHLLVGLGHRLQQFGRLQPSLPESR